MISSIFESLAAFALRTAVIAVLVHCATIFGLLPIQNAAAEEIPFRSYGAADGLNNLGLSCLREDRMGYMFACTQHGLYVYDGRRFVNLGPQQGLPQGGTVIEVVFDASDHAIVRFPDRVYASISPTSSVMPPQALKFAQATPFGGAIYNDGPGQITPWSDGAILIDSGQLDFVASSDGGGSPRIAPIAGRLRQPDGLIKNATVVASNADTLWVALSDGHICSLKTSSERCYGLNDGLPQVQWRVLLAQGSATLIARSQDNLAIINQRTNSIEVEQLPFQGQRYDDYSRLLTLALAPSGELLTQSDTGLMIKTPAGWTTLNSLSGLPKDPIVSILFDQEKSLWLGVRGKGALRALGFGVWQNLNHQDGLSDDVDWQMSRQPGGALWVATDRGVDAIDKPPAVSLLVRNDERPSFAVVIGAGGHVWHSIGSVGASCINTTNGSKRDFALPTVTAIVRGAANRIWFATENGLYFVDDTPGVPPPPQRMLIPAMQFSSAASSPNGDLWLISRQRLLRLRADGVLESIIDNWGQEEFTPYVLAVEKPGTVWVGGSGGVFQVFAQASQPARIASVGLPELLSNTVVALLVDRRGWLWAGTDNGVSVFDGQRWVSATTDNGLVWNDISQDGLYEDADGSIWISTSQGLSHLLDPDRLFARRILQPVITKISIGDLSYRGHAVPFLHGALDIQFGTLNFQAESSVRFRYRLEGSDSSWADTNLGTARYPFLPWGRHRFTILAYDELTHQESAPVTVLLRMRPPWWCWWPLEAFGLIAIVAACYGLLRLRFSYLLRQRRVLQQTVEMRTMEINAAHEALLLQASQDSLTRLLTRGEIQKRLVETLAHGKRHPNLTIGLLDIDHFKRINDRFGHLAGDEILREIGQRLNLAMRAGELGGRYGGEEILMVVTGDRGDGVTRMRELNASISARPFLVEDEVIHVTCSTGVARATTQDSWKTLIGRADRALYHAKESGRDQVVEAPFDQIVSRNAS